jgi:hypothetical protein
MPIEPGSLSLGVVAGGLIVGFANHFLSKSRSIEAIRITEFNKGASVFRAAFVDIIYSLRQNSEMGSELIAKIITPEILLAHEKAKILFEPFLNKSELQGFNMAWENYVNCKYNYYTHLTSDPSAGSDNDRKQFSQFCLDHIDKLLNYAKPKMT